MLGLALKLGNDTRNVPVSSHALPLNHIISHNCSSSLQHTVVILSLSLKTHKL